MNEPRHAWELADPEVVQNIGKLIVRLVLSGADIPCTAEGRIKLLKENGLVFTGPIDDVEIHKSTARHMHLALPPKKYLKKGVALVTNPDTADQYRVPRQYSDFHMQTIDALDPLDMYYFRIGDYSLSHCT